jgi:hypothetical protein
VDKPKRESLIPTHEEIREYINRHPHLKNFSFGQIASEIRGITSSLGYRISRIVPGILRSYSRGYNVALDALKFLLDVKSRKIR